MDPEQNQKIFQTNRIIIILLGILSAIGIGTVLFFSRSIILPFALAVFLYYILNPLINFFEKRRVPALFSTFLALVITFLLMNLLGVIIFTSIKSFAANAGQYEQRLSNIAYDVMDFFEVPIENIEIKTIPEDSLTVSKGVPDSLMTDLPQEEQFSIWRNLRKFSISGYIIKTLGSILNFLSDTALVMLFLLFILVGRNQLNNKVKLAFEKDTSQRISTILTNINGQIQKYLLTKTFISLLTGVLVTIVLILFNVEFALVWGILTFLLNFIPTIGSFIATVLPLGVAFLQNIDHPIVVVWIGLCLFLVQFSIANLLEPRIVGRSLNLSPLVVLMSLMFWGWLWGIIGMFLAVPIAVIGKIIFENIESLRFLSVLMSAYRE
jgi:predicted PurR-regulated permease PerM